MMWYLANLYFDYSEYEDIAKKYVLDLENRNIHRIRTEVVKIVTSPSNEQFFGRYGLGKLLPIPDVEDVEMSPHSNHIIGKWFFILAASFLTPTPVSVGYDWRIVEEGLKELDWSDEELKLLLNGELMAALLGKAAIRKEVIQHNDPYWYWIRPDYSYNQGGWLPISACEMFYEKISAIVEKGIDNSSMPFMSSKEDPWIKSFDLGLKKFLFLFSEAEKRKCGIYSAIYWDWEEHETDA